MRAAHNGTITMTAVKAMTKQQLIEEYEYICRRLKRIASSVLLLQPHTAIDPDSAGVVLSNPAEVHLVSRFLTLSVPPTIHSNGFSGSQTTIAVGVLVVVVVDNSLKMNLLIPRVKEINQLKDVCHSRDESDDDMEHYIPPLPYGEFKDWEMVSCPPGNNHIHVYYQQNRRRNSILTGNTAWEKGERKKKKGERMLRPRLTRSKPSYCRDVVVAGSVIQTVQTGLRQSYECLASAPFLRAANTARTNGFSAAPWLTAKKESAQTPL
ncbi:hypothetical protein Tco_0386441 [Tanacetum coccineum]